MIRFRSWQRESIGDFRGLKVRLVFGSRICDGEIQRQRSTLSVYVTFRGATYVVGSSVEFKVSDREKGDVVCLFWGGGGGFCRASRFLWSKD